MSGSNPLILLHNSQWASNIGNAFYDLGIEHILNEACGDARVVSTDHLSSIVWRRPRWLLESNDLQYPRYSAPDWFVLSGPLFKIEFVERYQPILDEVFRKDGDTKLAILNAGSIEYSDAEVGRCREFLSRYPTSVLTTRDQFTYEAYSDCADHAYNGIDTAFFCSCCYEGYATPRLEPYIALTFDKVREPDIDLGGFQASEPSTWGDVEVSQRWSPGYRYSKVFDVLRSYPAIVGDYRVVRPTHKMVRENVFGLFGKPNSLVSLRPHAYLNVYANTSLTISDRVHACIATLSFGNPARLVSSTERQRLFRRVDLGEISEAVRSIDRDVVRQEKEDYIEFIRSVYEEEFGHDDS